MIEKISNSVYKLNVDSNVYLLDLAEKIIIDTGPPNYKDVVKKSLSEVINLDKITKNSESVGYAFEPHLGHKTD